MANETHGQYILRKENVDSAVKGFALLKYKFKQVCSVQSSSAWKETYFEEDRNVLSGAGTREGRLKYTSRGAGFPFLEPNWSEKSARHQKHPGESVCYWEDIKTNEIDVLARTTMRVGEAIANSVDAAIYAAWIGASGILTSALTDPWDDATITDRDPIYDILTAIRKIDEYNYDALENGYLLLSPIDHVNLMRNSKVINNPSFKGVDVVKNGVVGRICGLTIIKSNNVPADEALVIIGQLASTWKSVAGITTAIIDDPGIKTTIRAWEVGVTMVTNPKAICRITNTQV